MNAALTRHEQAPAGEEAAIAEILTIIKANLRKQFPTGQGDMRRDAHPKHHGAVRAELVVELQPDHLRGDAPIRLFVGANPLEWHLKALANANKIRVRVSNMFSLQFWTMTPYLMGDTPAKFSVRPQVLANTGAPPNSVPDYLRHVMARQLQREGVAFDFLVQLQADARGMPVEDPRIRWEPAHAPWRKVATLHIRAQTFDSPGQLQFAKDLSYSPWHSVPEHRPLGGVNRCRRIIYRAISQFRHEANGRRALEPTGAQRF
jgi:hypothetical protein